MTFVYEHISDEDKKRIDFSKITVGGYEANPNWWAIDREQNAFLVWVYPDREPPYECWYAFCWQGKVFPVALREEDRIQTSDNKWIIPVKYRFLLPEEILPASSELEAILKKIEEAIQIETHGSYRKANWWHDIVGIQVEYSKTGDIK